MASDAMDVAGNWHGMMIHHPSRGRIHVSFAGETGTFKGKWDFPKVSKGSAKKGEFVAVRFANWLNIRITTKPLSDVQFQLAIVKEKGESMITGIIPLEDAKFPFATVTLFRHELPDIEIDPICPVDEFRPGAK